MDNGWRGFKICHESEYFKEKVFLHQGFKDADAWIAAVSEEADFSELNQKY